VQPAITVATKGETYELHRIKEGSWNGTHFALVLSGRTTEHVIHIDDVVHVIAPLEVHDEQAEARRARLSQVSRVRADSPGDVRAHLMIPPGDEEQSEESRHLPEEKEPEVRPRVIERPKNNYDFHMSVRRDRGDYNRSQPYDVNDSFRWCGHTVVVWRRVGPYIDILLPDNSTKRLKSL
jgi:hypothetical protein